MENLEVRKAANELGVKLWEVSEALGINDGNLSRKLRRELPEDERQRWLALISEIADRKERVYLVAEDEND